MQGHCALINTAWKRPAARRLKLTGRFGLITVKVTTTGLVVPGVNAGIKTTALVALTNVSDCSPVGEPAPLTLTEPAPGVAVN